MCTCGRIIFSYILIVPTQQIVKYINIRVGICYLEYSMSIFSESEIIIVTIIDVRATRRLKLNL